MPDPQALTARIVLSGLTGSREWVATAATQHTPAGGSVVVTTTISTSGATPPAVATTLELRFYNDNGTLIRTQALTPGTTPQTTTFHFTDTGLSGGAARAGLVHIALYAQRTTGGPTSTYEIESDGSPAVGNTTHGTITTERGYINGSTTGTVAISNVSAGGAKIQPAKYLESLFVRVTLAHQTYVARPLTVAITNTTPALSASTNSTTAAARDVSFSNVVDKRFPAAVTGVSTTVTVPNATLSGQPAFQITSLTNDTINVDPRLTVTHLLYLNLSTYQSPPLSRHTTDYRRRQSELAYLGTNVRDARGSVAANVVSGGVNGVSLSTVLASSVDPTQTVTQSNVTTANAQGEAGWTTLVAWPNSLPGGIWTKTVTIGSGTTNLTDAYLIGATQNHVLIARNDDLLAVCIVGSNDPNNHLTPGTTFEIDAWLINMAARVHATADEVTVVIRRQNSANKAQFWNGSAWVDSHDGSGNTVEATQFPLTQRPNQNVWSLSIVSDATWTNDPIVICRIVKDGVFYPAADLREVTGSANAHSGHVLDAVGLALTGGLTFK